MVIRHAVARLLAAAASGVRESAPPPHLRAANRPGPTDDREAAGDPKLSEFVPGTGRQVRVLLRKVQSLVVGEGVWTEGDGYLSSHYRPFLALSRDPDPIVQVQ